MQGTISLQSKLDQGTIATFSIPFNKPQFQSATTPLVDIGALPDRLLSELSLSCNTSSRGSNALPGRATPPLQSPAFADSPGMEVNRNKPTVGASPPQTQLTEEQKKNFHILVVEDNAINQQIALKTIRNLGFSVFAVWNGKEALDYLYKATDSAQSPSSAKTLTPSTTADTSTPLPNLILMDVQMPILDGYRATHTLRHHAPFKDNQLIQKIPIVAMTASAIQGDREKCKRAGMDDYMAKPVKRINLEKMILKWVKDASHMKPRNYVGPGHGKSDSLERPDMTHCGTGDSSNCVGTEYSSPERPESHTPSAIAAAPSHHHHHHHRQLPTQNHKRPSLTSTMSEEKVQSLRTAGEPNTALSEADRGLRRVEAEEQAANLRDEKLLAATDPGPQYTLDGGAGISSGAGRGGGGGGLGSSSPLLVGTAATGLPFSSGSPLGGVGAGANGGAESYSDQRAANAGNENIMALTEENVERFNADKADDAAVVPPAAISPAGATSTKAIGGDLAGEGKLDPESLLSPPPLLLQDEDEEKRLGVAGTVEKSDPTEVFEMPERQQRRQQQQQQVAGQNAQWLGVKTREGRLSVQDRSRSDWSESTAKP
jgi:CheY-like chemotaxis protein